MKYLVGLACLAFASAASAFSYTKEFTEAELQAQIEAMMPLELKKFFVSVSIIEPKLDLIANENRIGIEALVQASAPGGIKGQGTTKVTGTILYNSDEGAFYIKDPKIVSLKINGVPAKFEGNIKNVAQNLIATTLSTHPVFVFNDANLKHKLAKSTLESIDVKNEKLLVKLRAF